MAETAMYTVSGNTVTGVPFALVATGTAENNLLLCTNRQYTIYHTSLLSNGSTAATETVYFSHLPGVVASYAAGTGKAVLIAGQSQVFGPGLAALYFKTVSGTPMLLVNTGVHQHLSGQG